MLVLSRKLNETIVIGGDIRIKVVGINGGQVRLGIEAPGDVRVMREELLSRDQLPAKPRHEQPITAPRRRALATS